MLPQSRRCLEYGMDAERRRFKALCSITFTFEAKIDEKRQNVLFQAMHWNALVSGNFDALVRQPMKWL